MRPPVTTVFLLVLALALVPAPASVFAGQIWTDGDGDGLPDLHDNDPYCNIPPGPSRPFLYRFPSDQTSIDIYIDSQSFNWTNYQAWIQRDGCLQFVSGTYRITGGTNFPLDTVSNPNATGFGGFGFARHGVALIGTIVVHLVAPAICCVWPIVETDNPYGTFSVLGTQTGYFLFQSRCGTCIGIEGHATEPTTWGAIKGIYQ